MTDVTTGQRYRRIRAHREIINSVDRTMAGGAGTELVATGSDDGTVKIWEGGEDAGKYPVATFEVGCPVTAVAWSADGANVYIGAIDNEIHVRSLSFFHTHSLLLIFLTWACRYTTFANANKYTPSQDTTRPPPPSPSLPTGISSSPRPFHPKPSYTTCGPSRHRHHGYIES